MNLIKTVDNLFMIVEQEIVPTKDLKVNPKNPLLTPGLHKFSFLGDTGQFLFGSSRFRHADLIHTFKKDAPKWETGEVGIYGPKKLNYFDRPTHIRCIVDNTGKAIIVGFRPYYIENATREQLAEFDETVIKMFNRLITMSPTPIFITDHITNADLDYSIETMNPEVIAKRIESKQMYQLDKGFFNKYKVLNGKIVPQTQKYSAVDPVAKPKTGQDFLKNLWYDKAREELKEKRKRRPLPKG